MKSSPIHLVHVHRGEGHLACVAVDPCSLSLPLFLWNFAHPCFVDVVMRFVFVFGDNIVIEKCFKYRPFATQLMVGVKLRC